jgi:hypothetical protein
MTMMLGRWAVTVEAGGAVGGVEQDARRTTAADSALNANFIGGPPTARGEV